MKVSKFRAIVLPYAKGALIDIQIIENIMQNHLKYRFHAVT